MNQRMMIPLVVAGVVGALALAYLGYRYTNVRHDETVARVEIAASKAVPVAPPARP